MVALLFCRLYVQFPRIAIGRTGTSSEHVDQHIMVLPSTMAKQQWLVEMLPVLSPLGRCIVFVATRESCDSLSVAVQNSQLLAINNGELVIVSIHGDKGQSDRNAAISQFKKNNNAVMIATDVVSMIYERVSTNLNKSLPCDVSTQSFLLYRHHVDWISQMS